MGKGSNRRPESPESNYEFNFDKVFPPKETIDWPAEPRGDTGTQPGEPVDGPVLEGDVVP